MTISAAHAQRSTADRSFAGHTAAARSCWLPVSEMIDVGHSQLAYRRVGTGPDVVLVHGWPLHSATFRDLLPLLQQHYTCHLFDLPGTGDSGWSRDSRIGLREHAESLRDAIGQLGLTRYALLGHDSGAMIMRLLAENNAAVTGLVMGNTEITGYHAWQVKLYALTTKLPGGLLAFGALMSSATFRRTQLALGGCFDDLSRLDGSFHELFVKPLLKDRRVLAGQSQLLRKFDASLIDGLAGVHARISAPVQMIWGVDDPFFPLKRARAMLAEFPGGAELVELKPGKLFVHEERPEDFCAAALPFLDRCFQQS